MSLDSEPSGTELTLLRRRDLLVFGVIGALASSLSIPAEAADLGVSELPPEPMSIGFVAGSSELPRLDHRTWKAAAAGRLEKAKSFGSGRLRVVPARSLPLGDQNLAGGAVQIRLHGLYPRTPGRSIAVESADLDVLYPSPDPAFPQPLPFYAWSFRREPAPGGSPPLAFTVPLGLNGELDLALTVVAEEGAAGQRVRRRYQAHFTADWQDDLPKLQRGLYLLGLFPAWTSELRLPVAGERPRMDLLSLALSVDPVTPQE
jgi:hypothetical protein